MGCRGWIGIAALVAALAPFGLAAGGVHAETRAVVVGIDDYTIKPLKGAVNDANDIADALRRRGVTQLTVLRNREASRAAVLGAIDRTIAQAQPGDLVIISFAGHGVREVWGRQHPPGVREGDRHETFILGGFAPPDARGKVDLGAGSAGERIWGTEMNVRLAALEDLGVRTIFVADTCHSGGLTRKPLIAGGGSDLPTRLYAAYRFAEGEDPLASLAPRLPPPVDTDTALVDLTFLAAVDSTQSSPEVMIPRGNGRPRGALSYAFARLIDGQAPGLKPGALTRGEIVDYIAATVRIHADNRQDPDLRPRREFDRVVIDFQRDFPAGANAAGVPTAPVPAVASTASAQAGSDAGPIASALPVVPLTVRIAALGGSLPQAVAGVAVIEPVTDPVRADLLWDSNARSVYSRGGDLIASDVGPGALPGVAQREVALRQLTALMLVRPRVLRLVEGDRRYLAGERVGIDSRQGEAAREAGTRDYYVLLNIAGTGLVQFLYPYLDKGDSARLPSGQAFDAIQVVPPFGADTLVLVVSQTPLDALIARLRALDNSVTALAAVQAVADALAPDVRLGLQQIFTAASGN